MVKKEICEGIIIMERRPKAGEIYRHFKNKNYQILAIALHSETKEPLVIYQALYDDFGVYARPLEMFVSEVDHEKYPDVTQKYRFEKIGEVGQSFSSENGFESKNVMVRKPADLKMKNQDATDESAIDEDTPLMKFLDAKTMEEKYNLLLSMRDVIDDKLIDDIAVVMDLVIPEGNLMKRYDDLKYAIYTRQKYEYNNWLR